jgi:hypothetical protein
MSKIINKGTGAGGANTNKTGLSFEALTSNQENLERIGFNKMELRKGKTMYYLKKSYDDDNITIYYTFKRGFKELVCKKFGVKPFREPDEAYIVYDKTNNTYIIKLLEKKNQNVAGSVEDKLLTGQPVKELYEMCFESHPNVSIEFAFCISDYLYTNLQSSKPKYVMMSKLLKKHNIGVFHGNAPSYFTDVNKWVGIPFLV